MIHFVFLLFLSLSFGQELLTLDYKKVYELALRNNKDIQRLQEQIRAFEVDYQLAQRYYLPIVYAGASILYDMDNKETKTNVNLSIISTLYEFQKTKSRIELSRIKRDIAQIMLDQLNRDIQLRIIKLFADAHLYKKLTEVKREEMAIAYVRFDRARERKELGLATDYEVFRLESIFREKRSELFYAQHMYNHTLLEIKQLAGIPYETLIEVEDLPFKELEKPLADFSTLREEALKNNASLKIKDMEIKNYEEELKVANQTISPRVNLRISTDKSGLELSTPIYDAGKPYKVEYLTYLKKSIQREKEGIEQSINLMFLSAPYEWEYLRAKWMEAYTKNRFAEENLTLRRSEYELELAFDLGYAMAEKSEAERQLMEARYKLIIFWAKLFNLAGKSPFTILEYN
ncbi:MAG: TolC family protein [Aquificota bacterium]|jgi:outer membrane protein TolC|nr:MAG: TolC family protein [Aquificota bacterium]